MIGWLHNVFHRTSKLEIAMSALTDAINRNTASVATLTTAINNLPPPVDETAAATAINANSDALDALTTKLTTPQP